jgi:hypothetical protein
MSPVPRRKQAPLSRDEVQNRRCEAPRQGQRSRLDYQMQDARDIEDLTQELLEHIQAQPEGDFTRTVEYTETAEDEEGNEHEFQLETERADEDWVDWLADLNCLTDRLLQARAMYEAGIAADRMSDLKRRLTRPGD